MTNQPKVSVIIVSWNVAESLKECLYSIVKTNYENVQIIVIDNASTDASIKVIKSFPGVKLITNLKNLGFPKAVNQGLKQATGDYLVILNPDTRLPVNFFTRTLDFFTRYLNCGVMGPKLTFPDGTPQGSVFPEPSIIRTFQEFWLGQSGLTSKYIPPVSVPIQVNAVQGACLVIPKSVFQKLGLFTEAVFMYYEDLDYCRRIRQSGLSVYYNPEIAVIHQHGASSAKSVHSAAYLRQASRWYNGPVKDFILYLISWTGQKFGPKSPA